MAIEIVNRQRRLRLDRAEIAGLARTTLEAEGASGGVTIMFVGRRRMASLNRQHFGRTGDTDVIAFPIEEHIGDGAEKYLGDMAVCTDVAADEAAARGLDPIDELYFYTVHGLLHILGFDDSAPALRNRMNRRARSILAAFRKKKQQ